MAALNSLCDALWYNGYTMRIVHIIRALREFNLKEKEPYDNLCFPEVEDGLSKNCDAPDRILWSTLSEEYGGCGTSPRCGWIERTEECEKDMMKWLKGNTMCCCCQKIKSCEHICDEWREDPFGMYGDDDDDDEYEDEPVVHYAVTKGEYSDYHIIAITDDKENAKRIAKINTGVGYGEGAAIEEYIEGKVGVHPFYKVYLNENGEVQYAYLIENENKMYEHTSYNVLTNELFVATYAKNQEAAIKIAAEKRAKYLAEQMGL